MFNFFFFSLWVNVPKINVLPTQITCFAFLHSSGSSRFFFFKKLQKNSSNFIQMSSCINWNSICFPWLTAEKWCAWISLLLLLFKRLHFLLAIQKPRLATYHINLKSLSLSSRYIQLSLWLSFLLLLLFFVHVDYLVGFWVAFFCYPYYLSNLNKHKWHMNPYNLSSSTA